MKQATLLILSMLLGGTTATAQILAPAQWSHNISKKAMHKGDTVELIFNIELHKNWHLFSNVQNYDLGPMPTTFEFEPHDSYGLLGNVKAIGCKKEYDPIFEVNVNYFENSAVFRQKIKILSEKTVIKGSYAYQVCNMVDGKCIMQSEDFEYQIQTIK